MFFSFLHMTPAFCMADITCRISNYRKGTWEILMKFRNDILFKIVATPFIYARLDFSRKGRIAAGALVPGVNLGCLWWHSEPRRGSLSLDANLPHGAGIERIGPAR
jgi:hypothetical protein